jgi:hypothetical protein
VLLVSRYLRQYRPKGLLETAPTTTPGAVSELQAQLAGLGFFSLMDCCSLAQQLHSRLMPTRLAMLLTSERCLRCLSYVLADLDLAPRLIRYVP